MDSFDLEPKYTSGQIPGKCINCLAEEELNNCVMELLRGSNDEKDVQQKFEMLLTFLKSPDSKKLRDESEKYLAEGKNVKVKINFEMGKLKYRLEIN